MKIAIYQSLPAGGANRSIDAITSILRADHEVTVFNTPFQESGSGLFHRLVSDLKALVFQRLVQKLLARKIDKQRFDVVLVTHDRYLQSPWILRCLKTPTVFLCQEPTRAYYESFLEIPQSLPFINRLYEKINRYFRKRFEEENAKQATVIAANSNYSAEVIFRCYGRNATPVHLGINTHEFHPEKVKKLIQVVVVGNDEPQKDLDLAIETVSRLKSPRPKLVIASPRQYDPARIKKLADKAKVRLEIVFGLDSASLRRLYSSSKLTLATAHLEPFGLSVVESMATGTPVVAVREAGFRETIVDQKTGFLVDRYSTSLAEACQSLINNPSLAEKMGHAGTRHVTKNFTWRKTTENLVKLMIDAKKQ